MTTAINPVLNRFIASLVDLISKEQMVSLTLMNKRVKSAELKKISIKLVQLKKGLHLSFVYRYPTNDITKNFSLEKGADHILEQLSTHFLQAILVSTDGELHLSDKGRDKWKIKEKKVEYEGTLSTDHDRQKSRLVSTQAPYLKLLGIANESGAIKKDKQAKYRQINKFIEIIDPIIQKSKLAQEISVADMGSGKGYLTFALYDHLNNKLKLKAQVTGIELRPDLVNQCNQISAQIGYKDLTFKEGNIEKTPINKIDFLIALHACNTATDDAIAKGILSKSQVIICSPCCHKQIRKQMEATDEVTSITQYGILKERLAEMLTDTIRALILEAYGYKTNVMEFISTEHTPKNLLITAILAQEIEVAKPEVILKIENLKKRFGIQQHHLEKLLGLNPMTN